MIVVVIITTLSSSDTLAHINHFKRKINLHFIYPRIQYKSQVVCVYNAETLYTLLCTVHCSITPYVIVYSPLTTGQMSQTMSDVMNVCHTDCKHKSKGGTDYKSNITGTYTCTTELFY